MEYLLCARNCAKGINSSDSSEKKKLVRQISILQKRKWRLSNLPEVSQLLRGGAEMRKPGSLMP